MSEYTAGSCNIGAAEIGRRKRAAQIGFILFALLLILFVAIHASQGVRLLIIMPAMIFSTGFIQSRKKFCLAFGLLGTFNFAQLGRISKVQTPEDRRADRKTALSILGQSILLAGLLTLAVVLLPLH